MPEQKKEPKEPVKATRTPKTPKPAKTQTKQVNPPKGQPNPPKCPRNLHLLKEGRIWAGTKAAEGVSASDMLKRLQLEQYKTQMIQNPNVVVSRVKVLVHNIPPTWDETKLKGLFEKFAGPEAVIKKVYIARDEKEKHSKEFGFVTFSRHSDALRALRKLNNNPSVFAMLKRPIVMFALESKVKVPEVKSKEKPAPKKSSKAAV